MFSSVKRAEKAKKNELRRLEELNSRFGLGEGAAAERQEIKTRLREINIWLQKKQADEKAASKRRWSPTKISSRHQIRRARIEKKKVLTRPSDNFDND